MGTILETADFFLLSLHTFRFLNDSSFKSLLNWLLKIQVLVQISPKREVFPNYSILGGYSNHYHSTLFIFFTTPELLFICQLGSYLSLSSHPQTRLAFLFSLSTAMSPAPSTNAWHIIGAQRYLLNE